MDDSYLRNLMVEQQLIPRGIANRRVLAAMRSVLRHRFMPESVRHQAYVDAAIPIGEGQTISQPYMVAIMTELLDLKGTEKVLEIGTGSGYQAAVLGELAADVHTVERLPHLAERAAAVLKELRYDNVHVHVGDGTLGLPEHAPFDCVIITAAAPDIPAPLIEQLREGGIIIVPVGDRYSQILMKGRKTGGRLTEESHTPCAFVPLIGEHGWKG